MISQREIVKVKVFDFFSGCGGASCGFQAAGMDIILGLDSDSDCQRTFKANFPSARFEFADIREISGRHIRSLATKENRTLSCSVGVHHVNLSQSRKRPDHLANRMFACPFFLILDG